MLCMCVYELLEFMSLSMSPIGVTFPEYVEVIGPSPLQSILGRLKSPTSMIGEDLGVMAREFRRYGRGPLADPGRL